MITRHALHIAIAGLYLHAVAAQQSCGNTLVPKYKSPVVAGGWAYRLIADGFTRPRGIIFDQDGALLMVDSRVGIIRLKLEDDGGTCLSVAEKKTLISSPDLNHGIALSTDGKILYASSSDKVYSWAYDAALGSVGNSNKTLIENMSNSDHTTRTLLVSRAVPGTLIVSRGSASNDDRDAADPESGHSQLRAFDVGSLGDGSSPYDFATQGILLGWGLRNSVGVAEDPLTGGIWSVENSVDQLRRNGVDIHQDNPGEELNFHGYLNRSTDDRGGNYGYPNCYALWSTNGFPDRGQMTTGDQFPVSQSANLNDAACAASYVAPRLTFQAHTAPLDIKFTADGSEALITFHGSWNRDEPVGYKLSSVSFSNGAPKEPSDSMTAAIDVLSNPDLADCPGNCFRPVGLAWDRSGRLFMTSDSTGELFVLQKSEISATSTPPPNAASGRYTPERLPLILVSVMALIISSVDIAMLL